MELDSSLLSIQYFLNNASPELNYRQPKVYRKFLSTIYFTTTLFCDVTTTSKVGSWTEPVAAAKFVFQTTTRTRLLCISNDSISFFEQITYNISRIEQRRQAHTVYKFSKIYKVLLF